MLKSKLSKRGDIEWQLWESSRPDDPIGPLYLIKNGTERVGIWGGLNDGNADRRSE
jgi:hypothetical protein